MSRLSSPAFRASPSSHTLAAGRLELGDEDALSPAAGHFDPRLSGGEHRAGCLGGGPIGIGGGEDLERRPAQLRRGAGPGLHAADMLEHHAGAHGPVDGRFLPAERRRIGGLGVVLGHSGGRAGLDVPERPHQKLRAHGRQPVEKRPAGLRLPDGGLGGIDRIPLVHPGGEIHGGHAGDRVAGKHRPLDGGAAPIFGQQRAVDVDASIFWKSKDVLRQDAPVSHHRDDVRRQLAQHVQRRAVPQLLRLPYRQAGGQCRLLHGAGEQFMPPALGLVRLAEHPRHLEALVDELLQGTGGKIRRPHEHDPHSFPSLP